MLLEKLNVELKNIIKISFLILFFSFINTVHAKDNCYPLYCVSYIKEKNNSYSILFKNKTKKEILYCYVSYQGGKKNYFKLKETKKFSLYLIDNSNLYSFKCEKYNKNISWIKNYLL